MKRKSTFKKLFCVILAVAVFAVSIPFTAIAATTDDVNFVILSDLHYFAEDSQGPTAEDKAEGLKYYGLNADKKHILIVGGSLGSGTLNAAMRAWIESGCPGGEGVEVLWQCGKYYKPSVDAFMKEAAEKGLGGKTHASITHSDFIKRMDLAYAAADIVISRLTPFLSSSSWAISKALLMVSGVFLHLLVI